MKYNFDRIIDRKGTYASKIDAMPAGAPPDSLSVWVADMDFACAPPILKALRDRVDREILGYSIYNNNDLKNAASGWFGRRFDWQVNKDDIFFSPGVVPALAFLINLLTEKGDGILIQRPVYYPFTKKIEANGRKVCNNALIYENGQYRIDYSDLEAKMSDPSVKAMILCSPHNPVGRVWATEELRKIVDIAKKYDKWIISDEIHMDLTRTGITHTPLLKLAPDYAEHIVACTAPSKTFNIAGLQLSNIIIPNKSLQAKWLSLVGEELSVGNANPLSIEATIAAYTLCDDWLDELKLYLDENIRYVNDFAREYLPKAVIPPIEGTYLVWIDLSAYESDPQKLEHLMQNTAKIAFDEGYIFGEEGNGFERINIAMPKSQVEECMKRMKTAIDTL